MKKVKHEIQKNLLKNEINVHSSLDHHNILKIFDVCYTQNNTYIITEICDKGKNEKFKFFLGDLKSIIKK